MVEQFANPFITDNYSNPTQVNNTNQDLGAKQFNVGSTLNPFDFNQQRQETGRFLQGFNQALGSQETLPQIQSRLEGQYGIPNLQEQYLREGEALGTIGSQIRGVPESVAGRTRESMVTESQRSNIVNKELQPLLEAYSNLGAINQQTAQRLSIAEQNLNNAAKLELSQQQKELQPWLMGYDSMNIMQAREYTGYTFANSLELQRLLANQSAGITLSENEKNRAQQLAMQENEFNNQIKLLEKQNEFALDFWG